MAKTVVAYVLLDAALGREHDIADRLHALHGVKAAHTIYGMYDVLCIVESQTLDELDTVITAMRHFDGVVKTLTLIADEPRVPPNEGMRR
jgi:DNA-binding Lrp family transcriptional regulator